MRRLLAFGSITVVLSLFVAFRLEMRTSITDFLPHDVRAQKLKLARELAESTQSRAVILSLGGEDEATRIEAAQVLASELRATGDFSWVRSGLAQSDQELFYALYFPARVGFTPLPRGQGPVPDAWIEERVRALKERLGSPLGMLERRLAPDDPLGAFSSLLASFGKERGALTLRQGQLVTEDGKHAILFAETRAPAFQASAQAPVAAHIEAAFAPLRAVHPALTLSWSGLNRFALAGESSVKGDIGRISTLSLVGIFLLYLAVFRSFREPLVVLLPISFGSLLAVAVCQGAFGFVHGLSLAFGSSIIGVAEDFSTHFFAHRRATPEHESNEALMTRLWPGMWLGALTTIAGIAALMASGFPGLVQMAVFGAVGVFGALISTRYLVPVLSRKGPLPPTRRLAPWGMQFVRGLRTDRRRALFLVGPPVLLALWGAPYLHVEGGMRALRTPTPELDAENERIQSQLGRRSAGRVLVALGQDDEQALQSAERATALLHDARARGLVSEVRSASELVPSQQHQLAVRARMASDRTFVPRLRAALTAQGFDASAFAPFEAELARQDPILVTPAQVMSSPLADLVRPFRVPLAEGVAYLLPVSTTRSAELSRRLEGKPGLLYIDQEALFDEAFNRFRERAVWLLFIGLGFVVATLWLRYRSLRVAALGMLPALLGAGAALGIEGLIGMHITLMHVIAVLLVLSMGVDYGIYVLESRESLEEGVTTLGSILLAALTTVLSFGLLGLSDNPALAGIGLTVSLGLLFTVLASPAVLALLRDGETL
jgi:predicted exporter